VTTVSARGRRLLSAVPRRRWEPWRDWAVIALANHAVLVAVAVLHPGTRLLLLAGLPLGLGFAVGTLTVLHDAGHRMYSPRLWPNAVAVQTSTPGGLWAGHWTLKHKIHHKLSQVYPYDEATRSSSLVRLHPAATSNRWQRQQHVYAWGLYGLAWVGELRSQLRFLRDGQIAETPTVPARWRLGSFAAEKVLCALVLLPYALVIGVGRLGLLLVVAETAASVIAAVVLVVGHINVTLEPLAVPPRGAAWTANLMRSTASFSTGNRWARWLTGGMTHHLAHHLRPVAVRSELPVLHATVVQDAGRQTGLPVVEFATFGSAVAGHWRRLRELGRPPVVAAGATAARAVRVDELVA